MSKRGLPVTLKMRHDAHYVDALASSAGSPIGRLVPIDLIDPNPDQPRQVMGDLSELMASIAREGDHRAARRPAARRRGTRSSPASGATRRPSRSASASCRSSFATSTTPRSSRSRWSRTSSARTSAPFEEAEAMRAWPTRCGYTHEDLAKRLGKSRTSVTESLALADMPDEVRNLCRLADISSKSLLLQIVRQQTPQKMIALVEQLTREGRERGHARAGPQGRRASPKLGRPKAFVFQYRPPTKTFNLRLQFRRATSTAPKSSPRSRASSRSCAKGGRQDAWFRGSEVRPAPAASAHPANAASAIALHTRLDSRPRVPTCAAPPQPRRSQGQTLISSPGSGEGSAAYERRR